MIMDSEFLRNEGKKGSGIAVNPSEYREGSYRRNGMMSVSSHLVLAQGLVMEYGPMVTGTIPSEKAAAEYIT